ncbi:MAG: hypothetical protein KA285_07775 [Bacteroidia bacterium]|nr:hypothetical protein [Bacteroidia bacterium]
MKKIQFLFLIICIALSTKAADPLAVYRNDLDSIRDSVNWINETTSFFDTLEKSHTSRIDSLHPYGLGYKGSFPSTTVGKSIDILVEASSGVVSNDGEMQIAISVLKADSSIFWESKTAQHSRRCLQWPYTQQKFSIPSNLVTSDNTLLIYFWNKEKTTISYIDDLKITFEDHASIQKVPDFLEKKYLQSFKSPDIILENEKFKVHIDSITKAFIVLNMNEDTVLSSVKILFEFRNNYFRDGYNEPFLLEEPLAIGFEKKSESINVKLQFEFDTATANLQLKFNGLAGTITVDGHIEIHKNNILNRAAIVIGYGVEIEKIIKETSQPVGPDNKNSFWLKNGSIVFKGTQNSYISDGNASLSSFQLFTEKKILLLNLDYYQDHPSIYFPRMKKSRSASLDHSAKTYKAGSEIRGQFKLRQIDTSHSHLSLLRNPNGFLSSMVWTEHADFSDIRTQRAVMFGNEEIVNADSARGGFIGHGIPITKSVFYDNPTKEKNSKKDKRFKSPSISIKRSTEFLEMLKQLKRKDFEICLHTPDPYTTSREVAEEAMKFMQENFSSVNWIDHGYDNSSKSNREDINCDGLDSTSKFYMSDLYKKYGVRYNWSSYYEDKGTFANTSFNSFFTNPYSGWDEGYAAPEYFRSPKNGSLISWRTTYTLDPPDGSLWSYYFDDVRLNDLVQSKGNCILHCYPARVDSTNGFYSFDGDKIVINPEFDKVLAKLKRYNDDNKIWLTTVEELLNYRLQLENVEIQYLENNRVVVYNNNEAVVKGVSVISASKSISAGEKNIRLKKDGEETIAIFDLAPKEKLILDLR